MATLFTLTFASCEDDSDPELTNTEKMIVGKWLETDVTYFENVNGVDQEPMPMLEPGQTVTVSFKKDRTYTSTYIDNETEKESGTWSAKDHTLIFNTSFGSMKYNIDTLDTQHMTLSYTESYSEDGDDYNVLIVVEMTKK